MSAATAWLHSVVFENVTSANDWLSVLKEEDHSVCDVTRTSSKVSTVASTATSSSTQSPPATSAQPTPQFQPPNNSPTTNPLPSQQVVLPAGIIAAIALGAAGVVILLVAGIVLLIRRCRDRQPPKARIDSRQDLLPAYHYSKYTTTHDMETKPDQYRQELSGRWSTRRYELFSGTSKQAQSVELA